jgi:hypothetical protein
MSHSPLSSSVLSFELSQFVATKLGLFRPVSGSAVVFLSMMMIVVVAQASRSRHQAGANHSSEK